MKLMKSLLIVSLLSGALWAQAPSDKKPTNAPKAPVKPQVTAVSKPAAVATTASKPAPAVPASKSPATGKNTAAAVAKAPVAGKNAAPAVATKATKKTNTTSSVQSTPTPIQKPASAKEQTTRVSAVKGRDPFVSPIVRTNGNVGGCDTGKKCLVVDQIVLKGIVKSPSGFIAVVENAARRAYFMRENDPIFNGKVMRITGDTVVFQEMVMDKLGKQSMREVVKKVNAPAV